VQPFSEHSKPVGQSLEFEHSAKHNPVLALAPQLGTSAGLAQFVSAPRPAQSLGAEHALLHMPHTHAVPASQSRFVSHCFIQCVSLSPPTESLPQAANKTNRQPIASASLFFTAFSR
jgi:hypothetical protein